MRGSVVLRFANVVYLILGGELVVFGKLSRLGYLRLNTTLCVTRVTQ